MQDVSLRTAAAPRWRSQMYRLPGVIMLVLSVYFALESLKLGLGDATRILEDFHRHSVAEANKSREIEKTLVLVSTTGGRSGAQGVLIVARAPSRRDDASPATPARVARPPAGRPSRARPTRSTPSSRGGRSGSSSRRRSAPRWC